MKKKPITIIITVLATIAICTVAAMYTPPGFGHSVTMITRTGGVSRHPVLLGLNMEKYIVLVTGTVIPPFRGGFRIALEGDPKIEHRIYSSYPPSLYLGINHFYECRHNTVTNISPLDKFTFAVCIKPKHRIEKESNYELRFYDLKSDNSVLTIPISFMELDNFSISKNVRRPYQEHCEHSTGVIAVGTSVEQ